MARICGFKISPTDQGAHDPGSTNEDDAGKAWLTFATRQATINLNREKHANRDALEAHFWNMIDYGPEPPPKTFSLEPAQSPDLLQRLACEAMTKHMDPLQGEAWSRIRDRDRDEARLCSSF